MTVERFAPSPTGYLHLGHAFSALLAHDAALAVGGQFLLRIEDIDQPRCKPTFTDAIFEDLDWLGLCWDTPVLAQSTRLNAYHAAVDTLTQRGLTYACCCSRKDIAAALSAPQEGDEQAFGPDGLIYPGTCRGRNVARANAAIRLDMRKAVEAAGLTTNSTYQEIGGYVSDYPVTADYLIDTCGDIVLARKDIGTSYHIAVVVDDAHQGVTHVTRGADMAAATPIHVLLQRLLGLPTPVYRHHRLIRDEAGKRLAKRHDALAIRTLRAQGWRAKDVRDAVMRPAE